MANWKKLAQGAAGAAGAGEALNVEDVFSTYLYTGDSANPRVINNGIALADGVGGGTSTEFDGNSDYLLRTTDLSNTQGSKTFTLSFWVYDNIGQAGTSRAIYYIFDGSTYYSFQVYFLSSNGYLSIRGRNSSGTLILNQTITTAVRKKDQWLHVLMSFDLSDSSKRHYAVNDVVGTPSNTTYTNDTIVFSNGSPQHSIAGSFTGGTLHDGKLAHFYMDYTYRDLTVASNRRLFIDANGGSTSPSTLSALNPVIYLPMTDGYSVGENIGTGGDFTAYGSPTIVDSGTEYLSDHGQGGLVIIKRRDDGNGFGWWDTERGPDSYVSSNNQNAENTTADKDLTDFTSSGFTLGSSHNTDVNNSGGKFLSYSFRKAPKFFDIVTYTGNGANPHVINHNLGSTPGMIVTFELAGGPRRTWHRSLSTNGYLSLNTTSAASTSSQIFAGVSSTTFTIGASGSINQNGVEYVAYLFAHNDSDGEFGPTGDQDIIKCGSYTGSNLAVDVDLGFEPQFVLIKNTSTSGYGWITLDNMRGIITNNQYTLDDPYLQLNESNAEAGGQGFLACTPTGFKVEATSSTLRQVNYNNDNYIYIAIRRGPMAVPESATDVFFIDAKDSSGPPYYQSTAPVDMAINFKTTGDNKAVSSRLTQGKRLFTELTNSESSSTSSAFDYQNGFEGLSSYHYSWMWRRAPNFFDVVTYTGDGNSTQDINHNLGVEPDMIWVKNRDSGSVEWLAWHSGEPNKSGYLNSYGVFFQTGGQPYYVGQNVSSTTFRVSADNSAAKTNGNGSNYIAYLFATVSGVSKLGGYTGNGTNQTIDCGFTNGARFVLLRRTDAIGEWHVYDSARGIVTGNDPYLVINSTNAQDAYGATDGIDPQSSGFIVNQVSTHNLNVNNASYIFYAIA